MNRDAPDATTQLSGLTAGQVVDEPSPPRLSMPTLTIVYHPDLGRIGERALLSELVTERPAKISRASPRFSSSSLRVGSALEEAHISRRPFTLHREPDGSIILDRSGTRTQIEVDGELAAPVTRILPEEVERGVLLTLGTRVTLLLHMHLPAAGAEDGDLGLIGQSDAMRAVRDDIRRVAAMDIPVLIRGETGTGKELVAHAIHRASARRERPMVSVNLAALPTSLAASELFGAVRGAFTGAARDQEGYFRRADHSTLFLDEIGEVPIDVQTMMLRALETGEIFALGAQRPIRVDVRLIAATDANLETMMAAGSFRAPLLHRLAGFEIHMPPLRDRRDDISALLLHFLAREMAELGDASVSVTELDVPWLTMPVMLRLLRYDWPGNVRQLRNVARQLVVSNRGQAIDELPAGLARLLDRLDNHDSSGAAGAHGMATGMSRHEARVAHRPYRKPQDIPEDELIATLREHDWDIKAAATALGISRTSMYGLIRASGNIRTAGDLSVQEIKQYYTRYGGNLDAMAEALCVSRHALRRRVKELGLE